MKKYLKKSAFIILALIMSMFSFPIFTQNIQAEEMPNVEGLEIDKVAKDNGDGTYSLQLSAYAKGKVSVITKSKPLDIVLVLDQSGSMDDKLAFIHNYDPVYVDSAYNGVSTSKTEYIKNQAGEYIGVTVGKHIGYVVIETPIGAITLPMYEWNGTDGNVYVPLTMTGTPPVVDVSNPNHIFTQFYSLRVVPDPSAPSKLDILKDAANSFVDNVVANGGDHRIAIVGYADGKDNAGDNYGNTELFIGGNQYTYGSTAIENMYASAFQSTLSNASTIRQSIGALDGSGVTRADLGMEMANNVFAKNPIDNSERSRVVVMFTDGEPNNGEAGKPSGSAGNTGFQYGTANNTINQAAISKTTNKANVYSIGVVDSLDPTLDPALATTSDMNRYMHYISSNYPNATSLTNAGTEGDYTSGKYLAASDEESLNKVFEAISEEISSSTSTLDEETQLIDYVSDYFSITQESDIKVYTQDYLGNDQWSTDLQPFSGGIVSYDENNKSITVTGYDYSNEYIADTNPARGRRLVVEVKVKPNDDFIGGNGVNTNKKESGIYDDQTFVKEFPVPEVSLPIDYQFSVNSQGIYIGSNLDKMTDLFDIDNTQDGLQFKNKDNQVYTIDGINNKFVEIKQEVKIDGVVVATYTIEAGKTTGTWDKELDFSSLVNNKSIDIGTKITPTAIGNVVAQQGISQSAIYVYKPVLTVEDQTIFLGEKVNFDDSVKKVEWVNSKVNAVKPTGKAPTLEYDYVSKNGTLVRDSNGNYSVITDTDLTMIVKNGNKVITEHSMINNAGQHQGIDLKVQVVKGELTITKTIDAQYTHNDTLKANQTFVFKIDVRNEKDGDIIDSYYQTISFSANEGLTSKSITIKGLQKGYYTISEVSNWSWKYTENVLGRKDNYVGNGTFSGLSENTNILIGDRDIISAGEGNMFYGCQSGTVINGKVQNSAATVSFINNIKDTNILGDNASAINKFKGN